MKNLKPILSTLFFLLIYQLSFATHNRTGEISYTQIDDFTIKATIHTVTKASSISADRDSLQICWGDNSCEWIERTLEDLLPNDNKLNHYIAEHTYGSQGQFVISMNDPNRNGSILNVNYPNSDNVSFHLEALCTLMDMQSMGTNSSPVMLVMPIDVAQIGQPFIHTPNAYDPDGDSLAYELITPFQDRDILVPNYAYPNEIGPGPNNALSLDPETGIFIWDSPQMIGEYTIAIKVKEYRNGELIGSTYRDMQVLVTEDENIPPNADSLTTTYSGLQQSDQVSFNVVANDMENKVRITAIGEPFFIENPATFTAPANFQTGPVTGVFNWSISPNHERDQAYQVTFKIEDDYNIEENGIGNVTYQVVRFFVEAQTSNISLIESLVNFNIFPNPATDHLIISFKDNELNEKILLTIHNSNGKIMSKEFINFNLSNQRINLADYPSGVYYLNLDIRGQLISEPFVVKK